MTREEILARIKELAAKLGRAPMLFELPALTERQLHKKLIYRKFGSYEHVLQLCGLERADKSRPRSVGELFTAWATIVRELKRTPSVIEWEHMSGIGVTPMNRRFGTWGQVKEAMLNFIKLEGLDEECRDIVEIVRAEARPWAQRYMKAPEGQDSAMGVGTGAGAGHFKGSGSVRLNNPLRPPEPLEGRTIYGHPIDHPVVLNAPVNEQGVVGLFVAMAADLGFLILHMQTAFPDLEVLRLVQGGGWQRLLAEVEMESLTFKRHDHPPGGCDMIICWVHNWKECPLPVLELSQFFKS